jgi:hypothetical protein
MAHYELQPNENELGKWTLNYLPPGGGRYTGPLVVTNKRLIFDAQFDTSVGGALRELIIISGTHGVVSIPKNRIKGVEVSKSFLKKQVKVTLDNGDVHAFDYGMLSVDKIAEAIKKP